MKKILVAALLSGTMLFSACSTQRVVVESRYPNQVRLTSQTQGCRFYKGEYVFYWLWGLVGTKSTAGLVDGVRGPVRIEYKTTPGSVLFTTLLYPFGFLVKRLEAYQCPGPVTAPPAPVTRPAAAPPATTPPAAADPNTPASAPASTPNDTLGGNQ